MSLLSAVSVLLAASFSGPQQLSNEEKAVWERIAPQVAYLQTAGKTSGACAMIDVRGLYIAHRSIVFGDRAFGRMSDGRVMTFQVVGYDELTQLVALKIDLPAAAAADIARGQMGQQAEVASRNMAMQKANAKNSLRLIGVSGVGPFRAELTDADRLGVTGNSRRGVILSEVRFEQPMNSVTGSLLFDLTGKLVGVLGATVMDEPASQDQQTLGLESVFGGNRGGSGGGAPAARNVAKATVQTYGPNQMNVAYSIAPEILERAIEGFRSPNGKVQHPALGIQCKSAPNGGALITSVAKGSTADLGGLRVGDILLQIGDTVIENQFSYTRFILRQSVGATLAVKVRREDTLVNLTVKVGS